MWLLNTSSAELTYFNSPEDVPGGYAILSHVWDTDETTYQEIQAIHSRFRGSTSDEAPEAVEWDSETVGESQESSITPKDDVLPPVLQHSSSWSSSLDILPSIRRRTAPKRLPGLPSKTPSGHKRRGRSWDERVASDDDRTQPPQKRERIHSPHPRFLSSGRRADLAIRTRTVSASGHLGGYSDFVVSEISPIQPPQDYRPVQSPLPINPRDLVPTKVRKFCSLAEEHGHAWAWADVCCIDKSSSAELSEAINSMFRYYALSNVCYVYLRDVSGGPGWEVEFRESMWHRRGWTLQELLAPQVIAFMSKDWTFLGTKADLAPLLADITRVPEKVLRFEQDIADICVARRMSWAASRETTRAEDEAYSLMGIFGVNMPALYGEGRKAFYRLQEEIMKTSADGSLFAWGSIVYDEGKAEWKSLVASVRFSDIKATPKHHHYLFAASPSAFVDCETMTYDGPMKAGMTVSPNHYNNSPRLQHLFLL